MEKSFRAVEGIFLLRSFLPFVSQTSIKMMMKMFSFFFPSVKEGSKNIFAEIPTDTMRSKPHNNKLSRFQAHIDEETSPTILNRMRWNSRLWFCYLVSCRNAARFHGAWTSFGETLQHNPSRAKLVNLISLIWSNNFLLFFRPFVGLCSEAKRSWDWLCLLPPPPKRRQIKLFNLIFDTTANVTTLMGLRRSIKKLFH